MSRLIALYPRAWRTRYEDEFMALLSAEPPDLGDRVDIVRGALDARLNPQLTDAPQPDPVPSVVRLSAGAGFVGGIVWLLAGVAFIATPIDSDLGFKDTTVPVAITVIAAFLTGQLALTLARFVDPRVPLLTAGAAAIVLGAVGLLLPWPILALGFYSIVLGTVIFGFVISTRIGRSAILLGASAVAALAVNTENITALILVPLGISWILLASIVWLRGVSRHARDRTPAV